MKCIQLSVSTLALAIAQVAAAGTEPYFTPLTESAIVGEANDMNEQQAPFVAPMGLQFKKLTSLEEAESAVMDTVQRVPGLGSGASMFDMLAYSNDGSYIFIPHETLFGAGVSRYSLHGDKTELLFAGNLAGATEDWSADFGAFDPARISPNNTLWLAEEWSGEGRVVEVLDPFAAAPVNPSADARGNWRVLTTVARVSHEGVSFSKHDDNRTIYFVDEDNSGSIYKLVLTTPGDYMGGGQTFVLVTDDFASAAAADNADPSKTWNSGDNAGVSRVGHATWVPITDAFGGDLATVTNPFDNSETSSTRPGRVAADDVDGTPFGHPEDSEVGTLASGNEVLYFTATSEKAIYSVEMLDESSAIVREFASEAATAKNVGFAGTTAELNSPDNLAQDALGNIYVIEDAPNSSEIGGDTWFLRDTDNDGVAESMDHFMSLRVRGSEATGMVFNPANPTEFAISVQHPSSTDLDAVVDGQGDAVWQVNLKNNGLDTQFVKALKNTSKK